MKEALGCRTLMGEGKTVLGESWVVRRMPLMPALGNRVRRMKMRVFRFLVKTVVRKRLIEVNIISNGFWVLVNFR